MRPMAGSSGREQANGATGRADRPARRRRWRRPLVSVALAALIVFVGFWTVQQALWEPPSRDGRYEWRLRFPGTPPGAKFKTMPGDDVGRILELLLADSGADWQKPLAETGRVEISLACLTNPSLAMRLRWWLRGPKGTPPPDKVGRVLRTIQVREVSKQPPRYEVMRSNSGGAGTVIGTFDDYERAEAAVLDELATVMADFQNGKRIKGALLTDPG